MGPGKVGYRDDTKSGERIELRLGGRNQPQQRMVHSAERRTRPLGGIGQRFADQGLYFGHLPTPEVDFPVRPEHLGPLGSAWVVGEAHEQAEVTHLQEGRHHCIVESPGVVDRRGTGIVRWLDHERNRDSGHSSVYANPGQGSSAVGEQIAENQSGGHRGIVAMTASPVCLGVNRERITTAELV